MTRKGRVGQGWRRDGWVKMAGKILANARARARHCAGPARIDAESIPRGREASSSMPIRTGLMPACQPTLLSSIIQASSSSGQQRGSRPRGPLAPAGPSRENSNFRDNRTPLAPVDAPRYLESHDAINSNSSIGRTRHVIHVQTRRIRTLAGEYTNNFQALTSGTRTIRIRAR